MNPAETSRRIGAVVLAAGASTRFGSPKQLFVHDGESLVRHAALAAIQSGATPVVVVLGADAERVNAELSGLLVTTVVNDQWKSGIASSLVAGLRAIADNAECDGVLVTLADQPRVDVASLELLLSAFDEKHRIVASEYEETVGVPAVFGREHFKDLTRLSGDRGAGQWLRGKGAAVTRVPLGGAALDVDTPADAARLLSIAALALSLFTIAVPRSAGAQTSCCEPVQVLTSRSYGLAKVPEYLRVWIEPRSRLWGWQPGFVEEVREAFGTWARAELPVIFEFTEDSTRANLRVYWRNRFREPVTGRSTWWLEGGTFTQGEIEIALSSASNALDGRTVRAIAMHEIGHLLGLDHSSDPRSIMAFHVSAPELSARDIMRAKALFKP